MAYVDSSSHIIPRKYILNRRFWSLEDNWNPQDVLCNIGRGLSIKHCVRYIVDEHKSHRNGLSSNPFSSTDSPMQSQGPRKSNTNTKEGEYYYYWKLGKNLAS